MGKGTNQIADELEAKTIGGGSAVSVDLKQVTKSKALEFGCAVQGSYYSNQCTKYSDLKRNVVVKSYKITQSSSITSVSGKTKITTNQGVQGTLEDSSSYVEIQAGKEVTLNVSATGYTCNIINVRYDTTILNLTNGESFTMPESDVVIDADLSKSGNAVYVSTDSGCSAVVIEEYASGGSVQHTVDRNKQNVLIPAKKNSFISVFCVPSTGNTFASIANGADIVKTNLYTTTFYGDYDIAIEVSSTTCPSYNGDCATGNAFDDIVFYSIANSPAERDSRYISGTSTPRNVSQCAAEMSRVILDEINVEDSFVHSTSQIVDLIAPPQSIGNLGTWSPYSIDMCLPRIDISFKIKNWNGYDEETLIIKPYCQQSNFQPVYIDDASCEYNIVIGGTGVIEKDYSLFSGELYSTIKLYYVSDPCTNTVLCRFVMTPNSDDGSWLSNDYVITSLQFYVQNLDENGIWIDFNYVQENFNDGTHPFLPEYARFCSPDYIRLAEFGYSGFTKIFTELDLSDTLKYALGTTWAYEGFTHGASTNVDGSMYNYPIVGTTMGSLGKWYIQIPKIMLDLAKSDGYGCIMLTELQETPFNGDSIKDFDIVNNGTMEIFSEALESEAPAFANISNYFSCKNGRPILTPDGQEIYGMVLPFEQLEHLCDYLPSMFSIDNDGTYLHLTIDFENACNKNYFLHGLDEMTAIIEEHPILLSITHLHQTTYFISNCAYQFINSDKMHPLYYLGDSSATSYTHDDSVIDNRRVLACMY